MILETVQLNNKNVFFLCRLTRSVAIKRRKINDALFKTLRTEEQTSENFLMKEKEDEAASFQTSKSEEQIFKNFLVRDENVSFKNLRTEEQI